MNKIGMVVASGADSKPRVTRYQALTLSSAFLGWMFDSMDLNLFTLILVPCVSQLIGSHDPMEVAKVGGLIIAIKLFAWGFGGILFGVAADRYGRARIMALTVVIYSVFTGLSAFAQNWEQLALFQAIAGFGIGGEWAAGAALVAESWPTRSRAKAIQFIQIAFALGFFAAGLDNLLLGSMGWRWVLAAGAAPAILTILVRRFIKEPEPWTRIKQVAAQEGTSESAVTTFLAIFKNGLLKRTVVGVLVASAAMIGSWGGLTLLPSWIHQLSVNVDSVTINHTVSYAFMLMMVGATIGYLTLMYLADVLGRRWCYFIFWSGALASSLYLFLYVHEVSAILRFAPLYGYFVIGGFGTFAAYLPELFPTRVRATGQGFCWNMARVFTGFGPLLAGVLLHQFGSFSNAAAAVSLFMVVGLVAIWFGPETKGMQLPD